MAADEQTAGGAQDGLTRRQVLLGGAAAGGLLAAAGLLGSRNLAVRDYWYRLTGAYGEPGAYPPRADVDYRYGARNSRSIDGEVEYGIAVPPGATKASPVCICLPGRGRGPRATLEGDLRLGDFAAQAIARGAPPFVLVAVDGGNTYWHPRASGVDAMRMLTAEFLPWLKTQVRGARRLAVMGWSMGGYGALRAAELLPQRFSAVCAVSPALWRSFEDGVGDAFDSARDYAANDVYAGAGRLGAAAGGPLVRVDCGRQDPFYEATRAFIAALPEKPEGGFSAGGHNDDYWRRVAPAELAFVAAALGSTA